MSDLYPVNCDSHSYCGKRPCPWCELAALKRPMGENAPWSISELSGEIIMEGRGTLDPQDEVEIHNAAVRTIGALTERVVALQACVDYADSFQCECDRCLYGNVGPCSVAAKWDSLLDAARACGALAAEDKGQPT